MVGRSFSACVITVVLASCASYQPPLSDKSRAVEKTPVTVRMTPGSVEGGIPKGTRYVVQSGDTLYGVAFRFELDPEGLAAANRIAPFAQLKSGQSLTLSEAAAPQSPITKPSQPKVATATQPAPTAVKAAPIASGPWSWQWPVPGKVLSGFSSKERFSRSVRLQGQTGDPVKAAAPGRVVYAGDGLVGLGNLVLIRHDETWLSAYGHNQSLQVQTNQAVAAGQTIATLGATGTDTPKLHFEIRRDGNPVDPLSVLPSR